MISPNNAHDPHDRESLSALFDGELHGDASRFAHKRLAQDAQWRQACGTWQLAGDVLRGQATAAAPAGFADRVQQALEQESAAAAMAPASGMASRRGWLGGAALAASVAVAAWFVAGPLDEAAPAAAPAATVAIAAPAASVPTTAPEPATTAPLTPPAAVVAAAPARQPRSAPPRRTARDLRLESTAAAEAQAAESVAASVPVLAVAPVSAVEAPIGAVAASIAPAGVDAPMLADPFRLPRAQAAPRPWPRAVLPNFPATGALTARYGGRPQNAGTAASAAGSPTFYPFEPRLPEAGTIISTEAQRQ